MAKSCSFQRSIQPHLTAHCSQGNVVQGDEFKLSREVLNTKRKLVVQHGKGNPPQVSRELTGAEEDKQFEESEFGD